MLSPYPPHSHYVNGFGSVPAYTGVTSSLRDIPSWHGEAGSSIVSRPPGFTIAEPPLDAPFGVIGSRSGKTKVEPPVEKKLSGGSVKIPRAGEAILGDYALSYMLDPKHAYGCMNAAAFGAIGFHLGNGNELEKMLIDGLKTHKAKVLEQTPEWTTWRVTMHLTAPDGSRAHIRTKWTATHGGIPTLTAAYVSDQVDRQPPRRQGR